MRFSPIIQFILAIFLLFAPLLPLHAQEPIDVSSMTREEVLALTYDQLLEFDLPELMALADIVGVSANELLIMAFSQQTTTASKSSESLFDSPLAATIITAEQIKNSGATTIPELFRMVPGMIVREQSSGMYDVHIRGLDNVPPGNFNHFSVNSLTLVMINGRPVYNYTNGGTLWETLPISLLDIERIDIVRGAASALYGASAVSGVINIITKTLPSVVAASGRMRTIIQGKGKLSYAAASSVSIPVYKGLRLGLRQNYDVRKMTQEDAYSYDKGEYMRYDDVLGITGHPFFNWTVLRREKMAEQEEIAYNGGRSYEIKSIVGDLQYNGYGLDISASGGYQYSMARSILMENFATPFIPRMHKSGYFDTRIFFYGFELTGSFMSGVFDAGVTQGHPAAKFDILNGTINLEYSIRLWDQLTIRPGFSFLNATYDDRHWHEKAIEVASYEGTSGTLGGNKVSYRSYGATLRFDWQPIKQFRLIAAARLDKYNYPKDLYPSYQFAINYKPHEHHLIRATFSRANRSSFITDTYLRVIGNPILPFGLIKDQKVFQPIIKTLKGMNITVDDSEYVIFQGYFGSKSLKLLTSHQAELGYRVIATQRLQFDLEAFGSKTVNFADITSISRGFTIEPSKSSGKPVPKLTENLRYKNIPLEVWQVGVTLSGDYVPINNLRLNLFGTWQKTILNHYSESTMFTQTEVPEEKKTHDWTPALTMGLIADYALFDKVHFFAEFYFKTKQHYYHGVVSEANKSLGQDNLKPYVLANFTITYDVLPNCSVQAGVRNLFYRGREFGFADRTTPLYQLGLQLSI